MLQCPFDSWIKNIAVVSTNHPDNEEKTNRKRPATVREWPFPCITFSHVAVGEGEAWQKLSPLPAPVLEDSSRIFCAVLLCVLLWLHPFGMSQLMQCARLGTWKAKSGVADWQQLSVAAVEKIREESEQQRFSLALASPWLIALPFLSCLDVFFPLWLLLPTESVVIIRWLQWLLFCSPLLKKTCCHSLS